VGVWLAKNDFGLVYGSILQKNCGFQFGFGITKLDSELEVHRNGMKKIL